jgi:hypothetical protein
VTFGYLNTARTSDKDRGRDNGGEAADGDAEHDNSAADNLLKRPYWTERTNIDHRSPRIDGSVLRHDWPQLSEEREHTSGSRNQRLAN